MVKLNKNFLKLQDNYLFSTVNRKLTEYKKKYPDKKIINLGIGDVTKPIPNIIVENMKMACDEMKNIETFRGYGPEQGHEISGCCFQIRKRGFAEQYCKAAEDQ